jgi:hypothetical protein
MRRKILIGILKAFLPGILIFLIGFAIYTRYIVKPPSQPDASNPCSLPQTTPGAQVSLSDLSSGVAIIRNRGQVCFQRLPSNNFRTTVGTGNISCMSSSCTIVYLRVGDLNVSQNPPVIALQARFAAKDVGSQRASGALCACSADCEGAGSLDFETGSLEDGVYAVKLGDLKLGGLVVPASVEFQCFSSQETAIPYTTPVPTNTRDPNAYPPPGITTTPTPFIYPYPQ